MGLLSTAIKAGKKATRGLLDEAAADAGRLTGPGFDFPDASTSQKTQLGASTLPTYRKAASFLGEGRGLDFGAGRGQGAQQIGYDTYEPFPREGFQPNYTDTSSIPSASYDRLTSLNVLNVLDPNTRAQMVGEMGRILAPGGRAIITTRGRDVLTAKGRPGPEPMSIVTTSNTYQKGFTPKELQEYVGNILGDNFTVDTTKGMGQAGVVVRRNK